MKARRHYLHFPGLLRTSKSVADGQLPIRERIVSLFSATVKRLLGTGERLRATLGDPD